MVYCCVPHCTSQSSKNRGISFHEFPSSRELTLIWLRNIARQAPDGSPWVPHKGGRSVVCGLHFEATDFKEGKKKKVLRVEAVPTVFPDHALDLRSKNDGRKRKSSCPAPPADTSTWKRLKASAADHEGHFASLMDDYNTFQLYGISRTCLTVSKAAPNWEGTAVVSEEFKELKLSDYKGKYLVFFFYPLDFTFVCPTEIIAFSDRIQEFRNINTEVVACSVDSHFTHLAWIKTPRKEGGLGPIQIPLLSDLTHQISKDYGVYLEDLGHTLRGLFIVDTKGVLRQITMNDLPVGRSVDETIRLVQAFQYTDSHGEVCPAGWKPGGETIIPNPEEKLKYFKNVNN